MSQNHRLGKNGRDHTGSSGLPPLRQDHPRADWVQDWVQTVLEYLQWGQLQRLSGQSVQVFKCKFLLKLNYDTRHHPTNNWRKWESQSALTLPSTRWLTDLTFWNQVFCMLDHCARKNGSTFMRFMEFNVIGSQVTEGLCSDSAILQESVTWTENTLFLPTAGENCKGSVRNLKKRGRRNPGVTHCTSHSM